MKTITVKLTPGEVFALDYSVDRMRALFASGDTGERDESANEDLCRDGESLMSKLRAELPYV